MTFRFKIIIFLFITVAQSQNRIPLFELHDRGQLWDTMNDDGTHGAHPQRIGDYNPSMDWPGGPHTLNSFVRSAILSKEKRGYGLEVT